MLETVGFSLIFSRAHKAKRCCLERSNGFTSFTSCILHNFNLRSQNKMHQVFLYGSPSCCKRFRIVSLWSVYTLSATADTLNRPIVLIIIWVKFTKHFLHRKCTFVIKLNEKSLKKYLYLDHFVLPCKHRIWWIIVFFFL